MPAESRPDHDAPPCTCITRPLGVWRFVLVYDPHCRGDAAHRRAGQTAFEPAYAATANYDPTFKLPKETDNA